MRRGAGMSASRGGNSRDGDGECYWERGIERGVQDRGDGVGINEGTRDGGNGNGKGGEGGQGITVRRKEEQPWRVG